MKQHFAGIIYLSSPAWQGTMTVDSFPALEASTDVFPGLSKRVCVQRSTFRYPSAEQPVRSVAPSTRIGDALSEPTSAISAPGT